MTETNKQVVQQCFQYIWNEGQYHRLKDSHHPDYVAHLAGDLGNLVGIQAFQKFVETYKAAFPNATIHIDDQLAEGDQVATRWHAEGSHEGQFMGVDATHHAMTVQGLSIHKLANGQIIESWDSWDALGIWRALVGDEMGDVTALNL